MDYDIIIVGGGPAGIITALTAKSVYPDKSVCVIKDIGDGVIPCAIPYMLHTMSDPGENKVGNAPLEDAGVEVLVEKAVFLDIKSNSITLESGRSLSYERLVLATGSTPSKPPIPGIDKQGVFVIEKSMSAMNAFREKTLKAKNIVILGGGFIGAEFADEFVLSKDTKVHIIEMMPKLLYLALDDEFCDEVEKQLVDKGVHIHTDKRAASLEGDGHVESVVLEDGASIPADMVLIGVGGKLNTDLARDAGLRITDAGAIWVDAYMRTSEKNIFAVGDCALKRDFFTRREVPIWLASTATAEARIAGTNIYGIRVLRQIQGTIAAFSTKFGSLCFGSAGMTCRACKKEGIRIVTATSSAPDHHPGTLPGASPLKVKLIFANRSGVLLGGQMSGGASVGELINTVSIGIQKGLSLRELDMMQIATHPLLTAAPTVHPLINAAHQALAKLRAGDA